MNKLCVREILSLSFVCGAYFFELRGRNLVCFGIAYNFNGKFAPEAGKARMRTAFFTRVIYGLFSILCFHSLFCVELSMSCKRQWKKLTPYVTYFNVFFYRTN